MISSNTTLPTAAALAPRIVRAGEGRQFSYLGPGATGSCLIDAQGTGGAYSVFETTVAPGFGVPPHVHTLEDEAFYVLEGTIAFQCGDKQYTLEAGMAAYGPRLVPHAFFNVGQTDARMFIVSTPGGFENFFAGIEAGEAIYGDLSTQEAQMQFGKLMAEHGMTPAFDAPVPTPTPAPAPTTLDLGNHGMTLLLTSEQTNGALLLVRGDVEGAGGPPPHIHHAEEEAFYLISGRLELLLGDQITEVGPGDFVYAPRHIPHGWRNVGNEPASGLGLVTPGANFQAFALEMGQLIHDADGTPLTEMTDPALQQRMMAMFQRHALEPYLPGAIK